MWPGTLDFPLLGNSWRVTFIKNDSTCIWWMKWLINSACTSFADSLIGNTSIGRIMHHVRGHELLVDIFWGDERLRTARSHRQNVAQSQKHNYNVCIRVDVASANTYRINKQRWPKHYVLLAYPADALTTTLSGFNLVLWISAISHARPYLDMI